MKIVNFILSKINCVLKNTELNSKDALKLMELNSNNEAQRNTKQKRVDTFISHIKNGSFFASQIVIGVFKEGRTWVKCILDGQHRLLAIIQADTKDKYPINILEIKLNSREEIRYFYQMFNSKRDNRSLSDLLKFKLSYTDNKDRWNYPVCLASSLPYAGGHWFSKKGWKLAMTKDTNLIKEEFLSDVLDREFWHPACDWLDEIITRIRKVEYGHKMLNNLGGNKVYGAMLESFVRCNINSTKQRAVKQFWEEVLSYLTSGGVTEHAIIAGLFEKNAVLKSNEKDKKGTNIVAPTFYLYWKTCKCWVEGKRTKHIGISMDKLLNITMEDVYKDCFGEGRKLIALV